MPDAAWLLWGIIDVLLAFEGAGSALDMAEVVLVVWIACMAAYVTLEMIADSLIEAWAGAAEGQEG